MIKLKKISKVFKMGELETVALRDIDLQISKGEFIVIKGPSGSGKSTLLHLLGMIDNPTTGQFLIEDQNITIKSERERSQIRKKKIGLVFQNYNLIDELTVYENIEMPLLYHRDFKFERKDRVESMLNKLNLKEKSASKPLELSGGQQQRVAVARATVADQEIILADEPTGNLDSANSEDVIGLLKRMNKEGKTVIVVTHSDEFDNLASKRILLRDGRIERIIEQKHDKDNI